MSGPKRNPDKLNTIGIVIVGICGAVLVYVSIVALQAFYMDDTSEIQTMADYGGQDSTFKTLRAQQLESLKTYAPHGAPGPAKEGEPPPQQTYSVAVDDGIRLIVESAKKDPSNLVPAIGPANKPTVEAKYGRPKLLTPAAPAGGAADPGAGAAGGTVPAGSGMDVGPADQPKAPAGGPAAPAPAPAPAPAKKG